MTIENPVMPSDTCSVQAEVRGAVGFITLNRPKALNALSLEMVRLLTKHLLAWRDDPAVKAVAVRGMGKSGAFGAFCAGGDIRFFHQAALSENSELEDFFTEEYTLNHLIHTFPKPYIVFMDGIVMGGGMGLCGHGRARVTPTAPISTLRIATDRTKMAMPETLIGLFPDVGGGYFLSRCPGQVGEWLALTGEAIGAADAQAFGLADTCFASDQLPLAWDALANLDFSAANPLDAWLAIYSVAAHDFLSRASGLIDHYFSLESVPAIVTALQSDGGAWAQQTAAALLKRSPLMLHVTLTQIRRARNLSFAEDLRMERDMVHHCFHTRHLGRAGESSETVEGIRALAVDKDNAPRWNPERIEAVHPEMVDPFFTSPWMLQDHPLRDLT